MTPVAQAPGLMTAATDVGGYIIGTLGNHAGFLLTVSAILLVFGFLASKMSLKGHR